MSRTKGFYDLRDALSQPGCPICRVSRAAIDRYLDGLIYEKVNDRGLRSAVRKARGFCERHAWGLVRHGAASGVAIIMRDVLRTLQGSLADARYRATPLFSLARVQESLDTRQPRSSTAEVVAALGPQGPCPVCAYEEEVVEGLVIGFLENLRGDGGLLELYAASEGCCLQHLRQVMMRIGDEATFEAVIETQQAIWARLERDLSEQIRKSDYRFSDEPLGAEGSAWLRALAAVSGTRFAGEHDRVAAGEDPPEANA